MPVVNFADNSSGKSLNPLLSWLNPPANWGIEQSGECLRIEPDGETDFWQRTHYGFRASNGHLLKTQIGSQGSISSHVTMSPRHQYDQAGIMVWFSEDCWLKTSVEFEIGEPSKLGVVVTNSGFSDWSIQDFVSPGQNPSYNLKIRRKHGDFFVEYRAIDSESWRLIRVAHLAPENGLPCLAGVTRVVPSMKVHTPNSSLSCSKVKDSISLVSHTKRSLHYC